jgi:hypothetical protein
MVDLEAVRAALKMVLVVVQAVAAEIKQAAVETAVLEPLGKVLQAAQEIPMVLHTEMAAAAVAAVRPEDLLQLLRAAQVESVY